MGTAREQRRPEDAPEDSETRAEPETGAADEAEQPGDEICVCEPEPRWQAVAEELAERDPDQTRH